MASYIERMKREEIAKRIQALQEQEVLPQGSESWLQARRVLITGSEAASFMQCNEECAREYVEEFGLEDTFTYSNRCASPYGSAKQVIKKKRGILPPAEFGSIFTNWGHLFEDTIRQLWQHLNGDDEVQEYGLITSPVYSFLAASPDGVSPRGIILEFKAPFKRCIRDARAPPFHYWVQCQILMECLCLPLTHYLEVEFTVLYKDEDAFLSDVLEEKEYKGCLLQFGPAKSTTPPLQYFNKPEEQLAWCKDQIRQMEGHQQVSILFYKIIDYNLFEIKRNRVWFEKVLPRLRQGWHDLVHFDTAKAMAEEAEAALKRSSRKRKRPNSPTEAHMPADVDLCGVDADPENENDTTQATSSSVIDMCGDDDGSATEDEKETTHVIIEVEQNPDETKIVEK